VTRHPRLGIRRRICTRVAGNPRPLRRFAPVGSGKVYRRIPQVYGQIPAAIQRATCSSGEGYGNARSGGPSPRRGPIVISAAPWFHQDAVGNSTAECLGAEVNSGGSGSGRPISELGRRFGTARSRRIDAQPRAARDGLRDLVLGRARLVGCRAWLAGRLREARHRLSDAWLSPDGKPLRSPSTEMSSSRSGQ
jgi:hypothetical protein